jgi:hypothetical protein
MEGGNQLLEYLANVARSGSKQVDGDLLLVAAFDTAAAELQLLSSNIPGQKSKKQIFSTVTGLLKNKQVSFVDAFSKGLLHVLSLSLSCCCCC